jgi:hypothetical protein
MYYSDLYPESDFEENASVISIKDTRRVKTYVTVDGNTIDLQMHDINLNMKNYVERIDNAEKLEDELQERLYVILGYSIYGLAIIFQALSTVIPNLNHSLSNRYSSNVRGSSSVIVGKRSLFSISLLLERA